MGGGLTKVAQTIVDKVDKVDTLFDGMDNEYLDQVDFNTRGWVTLSKENSAARAKANTTAANAGMFKEKLKDEDLKKLIHGLDIPFLQDDQDLPNPLEKTSVFQLTTIAGLQEKRDLKDPKIFYKKEEDVSRTINEVFGPSTLPPQTVYWQRWDSDNTLRNISFCGIGAYYVAKVTRPNGPIKVPDNAHYEINFASWAKYSVRPGFYRYGCITYYDTQKNPVGIWWPEKSRLVLPHEPDYPLACLIFRSTLITVATIQDHLIKVHWIVGNSGVVNAERYLGKNHLVRRFLKPHIYGTVAINFGSTVLLAPVDGLAYRVFAFDKNSWIPMVLDCFQAFRYESLRERMTRQGLTDQDVVDIPFYHDGFAFEQIMEEYITAYLALIYPTENDDLALQQDKELHDFWQGYVSYFGKMKESHGIEFQQLGNLTRSNLIRLLTHHLFWVTGGHQYLGYVIEYLNANGAMPSKVCIDLPKKKKITLTGTGEKDKEKKEKEEEVIQIHSDVQTMLQSLSLMALTSGPQPMLIDAWEHLWHDKQLTMTDTLKKSIVENLHTWQQALRNLSGKIDEWNKARIQPFDAFNPKLIESSVSV